MKQQLPSGSITDRTSTCHEILRLHMLLKACDWDINKVSTSQRNLVDNCITYGYLNEDYSLGKEYYALLEVENPNNPINGSQS